MYRKKPGLGYAMLETEGNEGATGELCALTADGWLGKTVSILSQKLRRSTDAPGPFYH